MSDKTTRSGFESKQERKHANKVGGVSTHPEKGTRRYAQNEKIINQNPALKKARDIAQGFKPTSTISTGVNDEQYKKGYDQINWTKPENKEKPKFKVRVNGVLQYPEDDE
jgi:hypothetical protein